MSNYHDEQSPRPDQPSAGQGQRGPDGRPSAVPPVREKKQRPADDPLPIADSVGPVSGASKITAFGEKKRHEDQWNRTPNSTGTGAIHVKTFHCKLTDDALTYMDDCINEWLDAHPEYEVKFVISTVGTLTGKLKEPHLICQVWV